jgi:hypothetical protein
VHVTPSVLTTSFVTHSQPSSLLVHFLHVHV